jgi:hypothetical protein
MFALPATIVGDRSASSAIAASCRLTHAHLMPALAAFVAIPVAMALGRRRRRVGAHEGSCPATPTQLKQDNIALVGGGFEAFGAGDMQTLSDLIAPDATSRVAPTGIACSSRHGERPSSRSNIGVARRCSGRDEYSSAPLEAAPETDFLRNDRYRRRR